MSTTTPNIDPKRLPAHVAIIMDGNGRWAQQRGLDRSAGHVEGVNTVHRITELASNMGIKYMTLYTFSTENWNRPKAEVDALMTLVVVALERELPIMLANNVSLHVIGDMDRMPADARRRLEQCIADTSHCTGLNLVLALSYSARWDISNAVRQIADEAARGVLIPEDIDDNTIKAHLSTAFMPDPDLLIRTGGDKRISNFLLWEIAYSEIIISPTYWPEYTNDEFARAIAEYQQRQRRFGRTGEQVTTCQ